MRLLSLYCKSMEQNSMLPSFLSKIVCLILETNVQSSNLQVFYNIAILEIFARFFRTQIFHKINPEDRPKLHVVAFKFHKGKSLFCQYALLVPQTLGNFLHFQFVYRINYSNLIILS